MRAVVDCGGDGEREEKWCLAACAVERKRAQTRSLFQVI